ncbi:MAG: hypothetical protein ABIG89_05810 [Candidatus Woesearchaeota archaeon]
MKKLIIFDAQGPIYHIKDEQDNILSIDKTQDFKEDYFPKHFNYFDNLSSLGYVEQMKVEEELVCKGITRGSITSGVIDFIINIKKKGFIPIIITSGTKKLTTGYIEDGIEEYNRINNTYIKIDDIILKKEIYSLTDLNLTKQNPEHWKKIIEDNYGKINVDVKVVAVFEDTFKWLRNAVKAFKCRAYHVVDEKGCESLKDKETGMRFFRGNIETFKEKFF